MFEPSTAWVSLSQFFLTLLVLGGTGIWRLAMAENSIKAKVSEVRDQIHKELKTDIDALREKHVSTERWVLETFAKREDLKDTMMHLTSALNVLSDKIDVRMSRIEDKIDKLKSHHETE